MKLLEGIPQQKYNDVDWVLKYLDDNPVIGNENVEPIQYFHCFWKGQLTDLHLFSLESLHKTHTNARVILWSQDPFELQGSSSWPKIKKLLKDKIQVIQVTKDHFKEANAEILFSKYSMLTMNSPNHAHYNHNIAYASDIVRFIALYLYGGLWFDMDILFLRNFNSIKINRYTSQWGTDMCGNAAIMRLEKGHDLIPKILKQYPQKPFYPFMYNNPNNSTFMFDNNLDLTSLPSTFFDILWRPPEQLPVDLQFKDFDEFFELTKWDMPKQLYSYHWHNRWAKNPPNLNI